MGGTSYLASSRNPLSAVDHTADIPGMARKLETRDPYVRCEMRCHHDLARGVSVLEMLDRDGPFEDRVAVLMPSNTIAGPTVRVVRAAS